MFSCLGGYPEQAVEWVAKNRIVSGGNYSSKAFCMPYPFPPKCPGKWFHYKCIYTRLVYVLLIDYN